MLTEILSNVLEESFTISLVIALVIVARLGLKKSPKVFSYALWGVVLFRLICPVTLESEYGLIPSVTPTRVEGNFVEIEAPPSYESFAPVEVVAPAPIESDTLSSSENFPPVEDIAPVDVVQPARVEEKAPIDWYSITIYIWLIGVVFMLGYGVREFVVLNKSLVGATRWKDCVYGDNIYLCDYIKSPFVMGILKPKIYIPSNLIGRDLDYIISHEKHHLKRLDHLTRVAGFLALSVHWFNPLVWSAFVLSGKDMELSCDEYVLGSSDSSSVDIRAEYSQALLYFACNLDCRRKLIAITPHAFGESGSTKERIVNIMTYKKTAVWLTVLLAGLVGFTSVALASDKTPVEDIPTPIEEISTLVEEEATPVEIATPTSIEVDVKEIATPRVSNVAEIFATTPTHITSEYKSGTRSINIDANVVIPQNTTTVNTYKIVEEEVRDDVFDKIYALVFKDRLDEVEYIGEIQRYSVKNPEIILYKPNYSSFNSFSFDTYRTTKNEVTIQNQDEWTNVWKINTYMTNPNLYIDFDQALADCNQFLQDVGLSDYDFQYYNKVGAVSGAKAYQMFYRKNIDGLNIATQRWDLGIEINYNNTGIIEFYTYLYTHVLGTENLDIISLETAIECLNDSVDLIEQHANSNYTDMDYSNFSGKHYSSLVDTSDSNNILIGTFNVKEITFEYVVNYNSVENNTDMKPCWRFIISPNDSYLDRDIVIAIDAVTGELI